MIKHAKFHRYKLRCFGVWVLKFLCSHREPRQSWRLTYRPMRAQQVSRTWRSTWWSRDDCVICVYSYTENRWSHNITFRASIGIGNYVITTAHCSLVIETAVHQFRSGWKRSCISHLTFCARCIHVRFTWQRDVATHFIVFRAGNLYWIVYCTLR